MNDHRKLGRELELFGSAPLVGAGLPIWLPAGAAARHAVEAYIREEERRAGYQHVYSPPLAKREMYERSGHLAKFDEDMFAADSRRRRGAHAAAEHLPAPCHGLRRPRPILPRPAAAHRRARARCTGPSAQAS